MRDVKPVGDAVIAAVKGYVAKRTDATEASVATLQAQVAALEATVKALPLESLERRASRHADHLGTLESRVQTLEHGKGKK